MSKESDLYEQTVRAILHNLRNQFGYDQVEGSTTPLGKDGNNDQVDVTVHTADGRTILFECRRCSRRATKDHIRAFAGKVANLGANEGILVNCKGFQSGAIKAANYLKIGMATLDPNATENEYAFHVGQTVFGTIRHAGGGGSALEGVSAYPVLGKRLLHTS